MGVKIKKYKGTWYVFIDHQGHRKAKKIGTRQAAETVKREIEARLALGDLGFLSQDNPNTPSFAEYADSWTKHHASRHVKPSTVYFYAQYLRLYVRPAFRDTRIDQIQRQAVKDWIVDLTSRGLSRNTVRLAVSSLRVVLNGAIEDGLISSNPAHTLGRAIKVEKPEREATALTPQEAARFLNAAKESKHYAFFLTPLRTGLPKVNWLPFVGEIYNAAKARRTVTATFSFSETMILVLGSSLRQKTRSVAG